MRRCILFHGKRHLRDLGPAELEAFLTHLAAQGQVSSSTESQAKSALLFLCREVLGTELPWLDGVVSANHTRRLPAVLTQGEVERVLERMRGPSALVARLLYGSGLRILKGLRLCVKDLDFDRRQILVFEGKSVKDRLTILPDSLIVPLRKHPDWVRELHAEDSAAGCGRVYLPYALARNYPNASREWMWQYVFPSARLSKDPRSSPAARPVRAPSF